MASTEHLLGDDAWLLITDDTDPASVVREVVTQPYSVHALLEYVSGAGSAGVFVASALTGGQRDFKAVVVGTNGFLQAVEGVLSDNGTDITVTSTTDTFLSVAAMPVQMVVTGASSATWFYSTSAPDVLESFIEVVGFAVEMAGVILYGGMNNSAKLSTVRIMDTSLATYPVIGDAETTIAAVTEADELGTITVSAEPVVHAIVGAPLGDLEVDIGKSVPWTTHFANNVFITDINIGDPRYWVVDWDRSFKLARFTSLTVNFFQDPEAWRQAQFTAADAAWNYHDDDWVLFVDGHEALSCDTRSLPNDVGVNPFLAYVQREITRAEGLGQSWATLPFFAFVRNGAASAQVLNIEDPDLVAQRIAASGLDIDATAVNTSITNVAAPYYYQPASSTQQGLARLIKVEALRDPGFDWSIIDTLSTPSSNVKLQVVSYGYAHWVNPETNVDEGFVIRRYLSQVRPLAGLPVVGADTAGTAGPYSYADNGALATNPGTGFAQQILTPMYSSLFRNNPRDGVWYLFGDTGIRVEDGIIRPELASASGISFTTTAEVVEV